jgi:uracil-DNA glycosylase
MSSTAASVSAKAQAESIPPVFLDMLLLADRSWHPILRDGLSAVSRAEPAYLPALAHAEYLPTEGRLFAAFSLPLDAVRYVLIGEGPYPRKESATGFCFMDGAVDLLWSEKGLSKPVNRATSLRNFMKMLLVADGILTPGQTSGDSLARVSLEARSTDSPFIKTREELQRNLTEEGFLLLNASLVFRPDVAPAKDAKAWQPFLQTVLDAIADHAEQKNTVPPTLVLWGKIAEQLKTLHADERFPKAISEHPYNLSFIDNQVMQSLFRPMHLLTKNRKAHRRES